MRLSTKALICGPGCPAAVNRPGRKQLLRAIHSRSWATAGICHLWSLSWIAGRDMEGALQVSQYFSVDRKGNYLAIEHILHRICTVGIAHHSFLGVVLLVGALPTEDQCRNNAWRGARSFPDQSCSRYRCLSGKCPPIRADRFLAGKFFSRSSPIG